MQIETAIDNIELGRLKRTVALRFGLAGPVLAAIFFLPAGTLDYWPAWTYMAIVLVPMAVVLLRYLKVNPALLALRMHTREKEKRQRAIRFFSLPVFLATFLLPGLDRRFGWSAVPAWAVIGADVVVLAAYLRFVRVMRENRFLSRVVEVVPHQRVIDTGPYSRVRHPMYAALIPLYLFSPLALGSLWALIPAALLPLIILLRLSNEEKVLSRELEGYRKYARRVKFRLIPGVW
jgi:protein-S-isoprenylcysteine O-methyltransferase Ste14